MKSLAMTLVLLFGASSFGGSFEKNGFRYPSPIEILEVLKQKFLTDSIGANCRSVDENNKDSLGVNQPISGEPLNREPNHFFVTWLGGCLVTYVNLGLLDSIFLTELIGLPQIPVVALQSITPLQKLQYGEELIRYFIGGSSIIKKYVMLSGRTFDGTDPLKSFSQEIVDRTLKFLESTEEEDLLILKTIGILPTSTKTLKDFIAVAILLVCTDDAFLRT